MARLFLSVFFIFFTIVPNPLKAIELPVVSGLRVYQTLYCMLVPSYILSSFPYLVTNSKKFGFVGGGGNSVIEALTTGVSVSLAAANLTKNINTNGWAKGSLIAGLTTLTQGIALSPSLLGCLNLGSPMDTNAKIDKILDSLGDRISNFGNLVQESEAYQQNILMQTLGKINAQATTQFTADALLWYLGKTIGNAKNMQSDELAPTILTAFEGIVKSTDSLVMPAYGVVNLPDLIIGQGSYLSFVVNLIYLTFGAFVIMSLWKLKNISDNYQAQIGYEILRFTGGTVVKMLIVSGIAFVGFSYLYKLSYLVYFALANSFGLNQIGFWALDVVLNYSVNSLLPAVRAVFSNTGNNASSLLQSIQQAGIALFAIFMQVTVIMRISTVVVKPLIAGSFSGLVIPIALVLIVLDWFRESMKNVVVWLINNLFILVIAVPILIFGILTLIAFNLTIIPSVAIQNVDQGGIGLDSTMASLITLFVLKGFIETIIESVNSVSNLIFSAISMDTNRMDRERDALMVGKVGGSVFKG
ncbi:hypothetical protein HMPREF1430_00137 [Helicobacter pylori GAM96Ai]|uniref:hypothetical protein n=1 Tax=Helicobacter pylori TaxID=210 RepID=UPI0002BB00B2|nr:hypothetical protein [Helicobacter pylori]EMH45109.1 hypothetical protein HMPREF1430_00137 [Helicobacter pylori GAM96Ai]